MNVYLEFTSKNDGRGKYIEFDSIEYYLQFCKEFVSVPGEISIHNDRITIRLNEPIYHTGDFTNIPPRRYPVYKRKAVKNEI